MSKLLLGLTLSGLALAASVALGMTGGAVVADPPATGMVYLTFPGGVCSGTLLSPTWVLTARHCVVPTSPHFGSDGTLTPDPPDLFLGAGARAVAWDPALARFVVAGWVRSEVGEAVDRRHPALWAFDTTGAASPLFGEDGDHSTIPRLTGSEDGAFFAVAPAGGGEIVAAGVAYVGGLPRMLVVRFDAQGQILRAPLAAAGSPAAALGFAPAPPGIARAVAVEPVSGDVIVVGERYDGGRERWAAARFDRHGVPRPAYAYLDGLAASGGLVDVAIAGGRVVVTGSLDGRPVVAVLDDAALGAPGIQALPAGAMAEARALAVDAAGRVLVVGHDAGHDHVRAVRLPAATLVADAGYGGGGVATMAALVEDPEGVDAVVVDAAVDPAGRLVVGLQLGSERTHTSLTVARLTGAGQPDESFGQLGLVVPVVWQSREAAAMALGPTSAVVVGHAPLTLGYAAVSFTLAHDTPPAGSLARLGVSGVAIDRIYRHPDASLDAALLELRSPLVVGALGQVRFAGLVDDPGAAAPGTRVVCYGYGTDESGGTGTLRRGELVHESTEGAYLVLASPCRDEPDDGDDHAVIQGGDSGGACFAADGAGATWRLVGVTRGTGARPAEPGFCPTERQLFVRADRLAEWVHDVTGLAVADPEVTP